MKYPSRLLPIDLSIEIAHPKETNRTNDTHEKFNMVVVFSHRPPKNTANFRKKLKTTDVCASGV